MVSGPDQDYYAVLEVAPTARQRVIEAAYRKLIEEYHPDTHPNDPEALARTKAINVAHDVLCDPEKRRAYDESRRTSRSPAPEAQGQRPGPRERPGPPPRPAAEPAPDRPRTRPTDLPILGVQPERVECQAGSSESRVRFSVLVEQVSGPQFDPFLHHLDIVPDAPWRKDMFTDVIRSRAQLPFTLEFEVDTSSLAPGSTTRGGIAVVAKAAG